MRRLARGSKRAWLCFRLAGIEMESEILGEFQCVARFVLGKPFSGFVEVSDGDSRRDRGRRRARRTDESRRD